MARRKHHLIERRPRLSAAAHEALRAFDPETAAKIDIVPSEPIPLPDERKPGNIPTSIS